MSRKLILRPLAIEDLKSAVDYIAADNPEAAHRLATSTVACFNEILARPEGHPVYDRIPAVAAKKIRKATVQGFKSYLVFYRVHSDAVEVLRVLHAARDLDSLLD